MYYYFYCPKIIYFDKVIHAGAIHTSQQKEAKKTHKEKEKKDRYNKTMFHNGQFADCTKMFNVHLCSSNLSIEGVIDCIIKSSHAEYIPIDYKGMHSQKKEAWIDHKFQLTAYALLIEEQYSTVVHRGFIYYIPQEKAIEVRITQAMKNYLKRTIMAIQNIVEKEEEPLEMVPASRCTGGCGYLWICGGIWNRSK